MIFGEKVKASIFRSATGVGRATTIFGDTSNYPNFTVRKFMNTIFQTLRPELHAGQVFGNDPMQLRLVFADWPNGLTDDFPVQPQTDTLVVHGKNYVIAGAKFFPGSHMEIYVRIAPTSTTP